MFLSSDSWGEIIDLTNEEVWTPKKLSAEIRKRTARLFSEGVNRGHHIGILHGNSPAFFADLASVWRLGACAVVLNPGLMPMELDNLLTFSGTNTLLVDDNADAFHDSCNIIHTSQNHGKVSETVTLGQRGSDPALILFTSGTTGTPKGVVHTYQTISDRIRLNHLFIDKIDMAKTLCTLPTHFGHGLIGNCLTALSGGASLVIGSGLPQLKLGATLGELIDKYEITFMSSVPSFWKIALRMSSPPSRNTLRRVHIGSAPLSSNLWANLIDWAGTQRVLNMYGITETANWIAGASAEDFDPADGLIGPMWGGKAYICDKNGNLQRQGEGELVINSPSVFKEYLKRPDLTKNAIRDGLFFTGDIGKINSEGVIRLTGRKKYEINRAGLKVYPEDIDLLLERHKNVAESCAFAIPDQVLGDIIGVALVPAQNEIEIADVQKWCGERLTKEKIPDRWFLLESIPKTDRGKVNRDIVAKYCLEGETK